MTDALIDLPPPEPDIDWASIRMEVELLKVRQDYAETFAERAAPLPVSEEPRGAIFSALA